MGNQLRIELEKPKKKRDYDGILDDFDDGIHFDANSYDFF